MNLSAEDYNRCFGLDFETTGVDPKTCKPVEVALVKLLPEIEYSTAKRHGLYSLINPECEIPAETSAVHHIIDEDVVNAPDWGAVKESMVHYLQHDAVATKLPILIAHNAEYEKTILGDFIPVLWICTYKCALRIWPDAPSHKNEALRYWLMLGETRGRSSNQATHSAFHDTVVTLLLFEELLKHATLEQMIEWTEVPAKLPYMPMGKYYKSKWEEVPGPYLTWCIGQPDMREDVKYCATTELARRRGSHAAGRSS